MNKNGECKSNMTKSVMRVRMVLITLINTLAIRKILIKYRYSQIPGSVAKTKSSAMNETILEIQ
ncbi:hypothetical protein [uncultured Robinsoniella sp.]|uniref:hypothetical protein n=1 Tax=uncultured Robinsoniella sp. TaxID=904190 RepID=UPI00374F43D7